MKNIRIFKLCSHLFQEVPKIFRTNYFDAIPSNTSENYGEKKVSLSVHFSNKVIACISVHFKKDLILGIETNWNLEEIDEPAFTKAAEKCNLYGTFFQLDKTKGYFKVLNIISNAAVDTSGIMFLLFWSTKRIDLKEI